MKKRILLIENNNDIRDIISYVLNEEGYEVIAADPWPADRLHTYKAHLILLDEWINEKAGHLLCTELKEMHEIKHVPVILLSTAQNIEEIVKKCKAEGYVRKPFDLNDLIDEVKKCLSCHEVALP